MSKRRMSYYDFQLAWGLLMEDWQPPFDPQETDEYREALKQWYKGRRRSQYEFKNLVRKVAVEGAHIKDVAGDQHTRNRIGETCEALYHELFCNCTRYGPPV